MTESPKSYLYHSLLDTKKVFPKPPPRPSLLFLMCGMEVSSQRDQIWNRDVSMQEKSLLPCLLFGYLLTLPFVTDHSGQLWLYADHFLSCMQPLYNPLFWSFLELLTLTNLLLSQFLHSSLYLPVVPVEGIIRKTKSVSLCPLLLPRGRELQNKLGSPGWLKVMSRRLTVTCIRMTEISHCTHLRTVALQKITLSSAFHLEPSGFSQYD